MRAMTRGLARVAIGMMLLLSFIRSAAAAESGIAAGKIFGIQIGHTIELTPAEQKMADRDYLGTFVRHKAEKPADVQFLQVFATPITRVVTGVDGATELRTRQQAQAFIKKYVALFSQMLPKFTATYDADPQTPLCLTSADWMLTMTFYDMKKDFDRPGGYTVRINLRPAFGSALDRLNSKSYEERKQLVQRDQRNSLEGAKQRGELKGLL
jgi:hypothetical protein